jgi:1-acyl-sn-glycerol-3-phosphate acyltransferase
MTELAHAHRGGHLPGVLARRVHHATLEDRDPAFIDRTLPLWAGALDAWFRPEVRGLERVPTTGPVLLVGNHSGGNVSPDTLVLTAAFIRHFGTGREFFQLAHDLVMVWPPLWWLPRFGTVAANPHNARLALERGAALLVYPGGDWETHRPLWQRHQVDLHHRTGFIRTALETGATVVPVVSIGGQETSLFLTRGERLAHLARLDRLLRVEVLPVSVGLPWGINVGDVLGHIPLPAKITIEVLDPIDLRERYGPEPDVEDAYADIAVEMQATLDGLAAERRLPVLG